MTSGMWMDAWAVAGHRELVLPCLVAEPLCTTVSDLFLVTTKVGQLLAMIVTLGAPSEHREHAACQVDSRKDWPVAPLLQFLTNLISINSSSWLPARRCAHSF